MKITARALISMSLSAGIAIGGAGDPTASENNDEPATAPMVERIGGEAIGDVERVGGGWRCATCVIDTKMPVGYPAPTAPGAVEIKAYPSVRRAEYRIKGGPAERKVRNGGFFPLFRHITSRDIAMTSPVEMDFSAVDGDEATSTMSFLYERVDDGPAGDAAGGVVVVDTEPVTVISLGVRGRLDSAGMREAVTRLEGMLITNKAWVSTGDYRWVGYNGPNISMRNQWNEVQVLVERVDSAASKSDV